MSHLRGALDLGTNSIQLLVARETEDGWHPVQEWAAVTRLGEDVQRTGVLLPAAMERTLAHVAHFFAEARLRFPSLIGTAAGTSALRDARNRDVFVAACQARFGFAPRVLGGREEAETTFLGVAGGAPPGQPLLTLDVGGGSTEISAGQPGQCAFAESLDLGCVRFGEQFGLFGASSQEDRAVAREAAREVLVPVLTAALDRVAPEDVQVRVSGGTATTLAAAVLALTAYDYTRVEGWETTTLEVNRWAERLACMTVPERASLPCVGEGRALVLPAGLLVLHEALDCLGADRLRVTTRGLRAGMLVRLSQGTLPESWQL
jgi:exopolyphosphatase / guanosine-5'-triphosphate,3'-diphosphate pyrophosphatase